MRENLGNFVEVTNPILNNFSYYNFFQISMDFEIMKIFQVKTSLTDLCSYMLIATPIANSSEFYFVQEVIHSDLQTLH
jgi:hypothetical protein